MICRLCLKDAADDVIQIFDVVGVELNVAMVMAKYFWFEPKNDDPISKAICNNCWIKVANFHEFYSSVEEAHRLLTERFSLIKTEEISLREGVTRDSTIDNISKCEPTEDETQLEDEIQLSVLLGEEDDEEEEDEADTQYDNNLQEELEQKQAIDEDVLEVSIDPQQCNETLFDEQFFVEKILDQSQCLNFREDSDVEEDQDAEDKLAIKDDESPEGCERRRSTRHSNNSTVGTKNLGKRYNKRALKNKGEENEYVADDNHVTDAVDKLVSVAKKRRGRPRKSDDISQHKMNAVCSSSKSTARLALEQKYKLNDEKIASYMRLVCQVCSVELPNFGLLRQHFTQLHQQPAYVICCNKKFYKRVLLVEHIDKHLDPECYKCIDCQKVFADKQCLRNHMLLKHQPDAVKTFECEQCPKKFAKSYLLEQHLVVHAERNHMCNECNKGFPSAALLTAHIKLTHTATYGTMCHICAKLIRGRAAFEKHQQEHAGVRQPKVQCEKCGSWHKDKYTLQKHIRRHNEAGTPHVCSICDKVAPNRSALLSHHRYVHASQRTHECGVCKKAFKKPINLREHMTMHTGEVLYSCPHCPKTFNSNANMHSHRKKVHPLEFEQQREQRRGIMAAAAASVGQQMQQPLDGSLLFADS